MSSIPFISEPGEITTEWLTGALREYRHLTRGAVSDVVFDERMKADRQINRVSVKYSADAAGTLPSTIVFKQSSNGSRNVSDVRTCAAVREVLFYDHFASMTPGLNVARCYATGVEETVGHSFLLLEDLSESHELVPDSGTPSPFGGWKCFDNVTSSEFCELVETVAELHAAWWGKPEIREGVFASSTGDLPSVVDSVTDAYIDRGVAKFEEKDVDDETRSICVRCLQTWPTLYANGWTRAVSKR